MLGRKDYTREEIDHGKAAVTQQLAAYKKVAKAATGDFEAVFFNNMVIVLDRYYVHRIRSVAGKDCNPLNEVELLCDSLTNNGGVVRDNNVIKYTADTSVLKLDVGDKIRLTSGDFDRLAAAFFAELEQRFT